jgi:hypothetical protein
MGHMGHMGQSELSAGRGGKECSGLKVSLWMDGLPTGCATIVSRWLVEKTCQSGALLEILPRYETGCITLF